MDLEESRGSEQESDVEGGGCLESAPHASSRGYTVTRSRLIQDMSAQGAKAGITLISAPDGMGKTSLLHEYAAEVASNTNRGSARVFDARDMDAGQLYDALKRLPDELNLAMRPLVAVDNVPSMGKLALRAFPELLRELREAGIELVLAGRPVMRGLSQVMGDAYKVGAQALAIRPKEYPEWTRVFAIDRALDVYALTQGVPSLVAALQSVDGPRSDARQLEQATLELYKGVLRNLRQAHDSLHRLACLLLLVGEGEFSWFSKAGMRIKPDTIARLAREYPVFGIDSERERFECMARHSKSMEDLLKSIAGECPTFARRALRVLMDAGRVDEALLLMDVMDDREAERELLLRFPAKMAVGGNAGFVNRVVARLEGGSMTHAPIGMVLAAYAAALVTGEYRTARAMAVELNRRADELLQEVDTAELATAYALAEVWRSCPHVALPEIPLRAGGGRHHAIRERLLRHREMQERLFAMEETVPEVGTRDGGERGACVPLDISVALLDCDEVLDRALRGDVGDAEACEKRMLALAGALRCRNLAPLAEYARMTAAVCRLMDGKQIVDERAFVDPGNAAVRAGDLPVQLLCLLGEGWQALNDGQTVNARFRAQQVLRLAEPYQRLLTAWATLLERAAYILDTALYALQEDAVRLELSQDQVDSCEAWSIALLLSASGLVSELSAWYSMHKAALLDSEFLPMARQAMRAIGARADALRSMLPVEGGLRYDPGAGETGKKATVLALYEDIGTRNALAGRIEVSLFGGFRVKRNGHLLTEAIWRRKRLSALTSRLVLALGAFVDRRVLTEEMWPEKDYAHGRENLYTVLSIMRSAFGQQQTGPQYILTQADGVALNVEYVVSDVAEFDMIARDVLLRRTGTSGRQIVELCLKLEEVYTGPLYISELGNPAYFLRMRRLYAAKFVDCMMRGVEAALGLDDLPSASWLISAAQYQAPYREDVIRQAMRIYDRCGRRREIVEMYNAHVHYLKHVAHTLPEEETRLAYEAIMGHDRLVAMM